MSKKKSLLLLLSLVVLVSTSCVTRSLKQESSYINNRQRLSILTKKLVALTNSGNTEDMKTLFNQI